MKIRLHGETLRRFYLDRSHFSGIRGPVGSGKSSVCCLKMLAIAREQKPDPDGVRRTRWLVVRRTYAELRTTTIPTFLEWLGHLGTMRWSPPFEFRLVQPGIDMTVLFMPMDQADTLDKVRSLEVTGAWINEAREITWEALEAVRERTGRYPSRAHNGPGATWYGVIADTNSPPEDHWWAILSGDVEPPDWMTRDELPDVDREQWRFFSQPPAMILADDPGQPGRKVWKLNPDAENLPNLPAGYYERLAAGARLSYIKVQLANEYGQIEAGRPVYREFNQAVHVSDGLSWRPDEPLVIGLDFGRTPAAVFLQRRPDGGWAVLDELFVVNIGAEGFARRYLIPKLNRVFPEARARIWGDPAGEHLTQADENSPMRIMRAMGLPVRPAPVQDTVLRIGAVERQLSRMIHGLPALLVHPRCRGLLAGFTGGYRYKQNTQGELTEPAKTRESHLQDALQYALCGEGEHLPLTASPAAASKPAQIFTPRYRRTPLGRRRRA